MDELYRFSLSILCFDYFKLGAGYTKSVDGQSALVGDFGGHLSCPVFAACETADAGTALIDFSVVYKPYHQSLHHAGFDLFD